MPDPISWTAAWPWLLGVFVASYLLGSVPFGLVLTRAFGYGDIRQIGSGNIGATNVLRTGNKALALATLVLDSGKGALAVVLAGLLLDLDAQLMAAYGALAGHLFPVWLRGRGGKGVATTLGVLLALSWPVGLAACLTWLATAVLARISSLSALVALAHAPLQALAWDGRLAIAEAALLIALVVWAKHHENIARLMAGTEPRMSLGARKAPPA